jgi:hypothetical protein
MIQLDLTTEEQQILAEVLESYLSDLRYEIANTDSQDFRDKLKHRKEVLQKALKELGRDGAE